MRIKPEEMTSVIKKEIESYAATLDVEEVGTVLEVGDGIARDHGLRKAMASEMLRFPNEIYGLALNLEEYNSGAVILGEFTEIKEGDPVHRTGRVLAVPSGEGLLGRVIDPLGRPLDGKGPIPQEHWRPIESNAPNVVQRQPVQEPLQTGLKAIDSMIPIGRGQRELIIGDRQTGKTALIVDTILNHKNTHALFNYVSVGPKYSSVCVGG